MTKINEEESKERFTKNVKIFEKFCPECTRLVEESSLEGYSFCHSDNGSLNIKKTNGAEEFLVHSAESPEKEADLWFHSLFEMESVDLLIVYGVGLGYYYQSCKSWLQQDPKRLLVFVERDFPLLRMLFGTEEGERLLEDPQVAVLGLDPDHTDKSGLGSLETVPLLMLNCRTQFSELRSYSRRYASDWKRLKQLFQFHASEESHFSQYLNREMFETILHNNIHNFYHIADSRTLYSMENCLKGIPAVICGAGPSLIEDLPKLKELQNQALILGSGTGMNILNNHGIYPSLGVISDPHDTTYVRILTNRSFETPFCFIGTVNNEAMNVLHGEKLYFKGMDTYGVSIMSEHRLGLDFKYIHSPLTSTHTCIGIAHFLGCDPIVLLGVDLAYTDRKRYPEGVQDHPLIKSSEHSRPSQLKNIITTEAVKSGKVETRPDWIREAELLGQFSRDHPETRLFNATSRGLSIPDVTELPLEEVARKTFNGGVDLENLLHAEIFTISDFPFSRNQLQGLVQELLEDLVEILQLLQKILIELQRALHQVVDTPDSDLGYPSESLAGLTEEFYATDIYRFTMRRLHKQAERLLFHRRFPMIYREEQFTSREKTVLQIKADFDLYRIFLDFCQVFHREVSEFVGMESLLSGFERSREQPKAAAIVPFKDHDRYECDGGRLLIHDEELDVHLEDHFHPQKIEAGRAPAEKSLRHFASVENGCPEGQCLIYYSDGAIKGEFYYKKGSLHGPSTWYSSDGAVLAKGWFFNNKKQGKNVQYYPSGEIYSIKRYKDGCCHGKQEYFYSSGKAKAVVPFSMGRLEGTVWQYYPDGGARREVEFKDDVKHGFERLWAESGQLLMEAQFEKDIPVGKTRSWHSNGQLREEKSFFDSPEHYDLTQWDDQGRLIKKKIYVPREVGKEAGEASKSIRKGLQGIKEMLNRKGEERNDS